MTTITKALDHLTDVLAGSDVTLKGTKADCIMQLADMIADGTIVIGGGGGNAVTFAERFEVTPGEPPVDIYTLTNAAAVFDMLEDVATADDPLAAVTKYRVAFSYSELESIDYHSLAYIEYGFDPIEEMVYAGVTTPQEESAKVVATVQGGDLTFYTYAAQTQTVISRSDIDPATGVLTKIIEG